MSPITTTVEVNRPAEDVFAYVTDPVCFVEWQQGVVSGYMDGDGPGAVGDRCMTTRKIGGAERQVISEITHIDPPSTWGIRGIDGPIRAIVDVTVSPIEEGHRSRVKIDLEFTGHGIGKLLVPMFVRRSARREMPENLNRLKHQLESHSCTCLLPPALVERVLEAPHGNEFGLWRSDPTASAESRS